MEHSKSDKDDTGARTEAEKEAQELMRYDWDFGNCPEDQLELCWGYEFSREAQWIIDQFEPVKTPHLDNPEIIEWWYPLRLDKEEDFVSHHVWLPPGFPGMPFLSLEEKLRIPPPTLNLSEDFLENIPEIDGRSAFLAKCSPARESKYCYPIYINWTKSDQAIIQSLRFLLTELRTETVARVETRGASRQTVKAGELKALGAYRLLKDRTVHQAMEYTAKLIGQPLYSDETTWSKARRATQEIIEVFTRS